MTRTADPIHTKELEHQAHLFVLTHESAFQEEGLWSLWAQLLEQHPAEQRERLNAIGDNLTQSNLDFLHRTETGKIRAGLVVDLPAETGEARLWHHLLLYGGAQRVRTARVWLQGGFQPWAEAGTTPLDLLLNTGDTALCESLLAQISQDVLAERFAQMFTPQFSAARKRAGEPEAPLYGLALWCLRQEGRLAPGLKLAERLGTTFTSLTPAQCVKLTEYAQTEEGVVQWWRFIHKDTPFPPPFPLEVLNALLVRHEPPSLSHAAVTRLGTLFQAPVSETPPSGDEGEHSERAVDVQRLLMQAHMKDSLRDTVTAGTPLLNHVQNFLNGRGVPWNKNIMERANGHTPSRPNITQEDMPFLQPLVREWAASLPLDVTVDYKGGRWTIPALVLRELFEPLVPARRYSSFDPSSSLEPHTLWMTLLLNALWHAASPEVHAHWAKGGRAPLKRGEKADMTRPWLFWAGRFLACAEEKNKKGLDLILPAALLLPETEGLFFDLHFFNNTKTDVLEVFKEGLWEKDIELHPAVWKNPSLFTVEKLETLWVPFAATLSLKYGWNPLTLEPALTEALCGLLEADDKALTLTVVALARVSLFKAFFSDAPAFKSTTTLDKRLMPYQRLLAALDGWFTVHPEAQTAWCALTSGDAKADAAWRRFWEQRLLEGQLTLPADQTGPSKKTRRRM